jgi:hypothetical protein
MRNQSNTEQQFLLYEMQIAPQALFPKNNIGVFYLLTGISYENSLISVSLHRMTHVDLKQFMISSEYLNFH